MISLVTISDLSSIDTQEIVTASRKEGFRMVERLVEDFKSGVNRFDRPGEVLLAAFDSGKLIAVGGLNATDSPGVGRIRRVYVLPAYRRRAIGASLVGLLLARSIGKFETFVLRTTTETGAAFYESLGFKPVVEPDVTHRLTEPLDDL